MQGVLRVIELGDAKPLTAVKRIDVEVSSNDDYSSADFRPSS